jgi:hypothetical protein
MESPTFELEVVYSGITSTIATPPIERPNTHWDNWGDRALWGQPIRQTPSLPPETVNAIRYQYPHGQIYPR